MIIKGTYNPNAFGAIAAALTLRWANYTMARMTLVVAGRECVYGRCQQPGRVMLKVKVDGHVTTRTLRFRDPLSSLPVLIIDDHDDAREPLIDRN